MLIGGQRAGSASGNASGTARSGRLARALSVKWLGQSVASMCWIGSMLATGVDSTGDWLQLCAASAWLLANLAVLVPADGE